MVTPGGEHEGATGGDVPGHGGVLCSLSLTLSHSLALQVR